MKVSKIIIAAMLNMVLLTTSVEAYIPDLFGSAMQGQRQAQYDNYRDRMNYQQIQRQRQAFAKVFAINSQGDEKRTRKVDLSRGDNICWQVIYIPSHETYTVKQTFETPTSTNFNGYNGADLQQYRNAESTQFSFLQKFKSRNSDYIGSCWVFDSSMPTGNYTLTITVGSVVFDTVPFRVVR